MMKPSTAKASGIVLSAVALAGMGAAGMNACVGVAGSSDLGVAQESSSQAAASEGRVSVVHVNGVFGYDQNALSSTSHFANVFNKAAAVLCTSLPDYGAARESTAVAVGGDVDAAFEATVDEMVSDDGARSLVLACACASNVAGGGAIANAEVEGVSLASIAEMAQAR